MGADGGGLGVECTPLVAKATRAIFRMSPIEWVVVCGTIIRATQRRALMATRQDGPLNSDSRHK